MFKRGAKKRSGVKRRLGGRRRKMIPRRARIFGNQVHFFKEKCPLADWACASNTIATGTQVYKIADLTNFAPAYKPLFDLYKLLRVKITIFPKFNVSSAEYQNPAGNAGSIPLLAVAPNRSPYVPPPANWADILNDDGVRVMRLDKPRSFVLSYPKPALTTAEPGAPQQYNIPFQFNTKVQPWLATGGNNQTVDQSSVPHYSHRWAIWNEGPYDVAFHIVAEYSFCMKEQD